MRGPITSLAGDTAVLVTRNDDDLVAVRADAPLAVGSAFKLAVLKAVAQAVQQKRLAWDQVVRLDPAWRSLPSGVLQSWPGGTPVTIETLADMMISVSDNTAADALIALAGRGAVQTVSPRNTPFLTTREACVLKGSANGDLRARWLAGECSGAARDAAGDRGAAAALGGCAAGSSKPWHRVAFFGAGTGGVADGCTRFADVRDQSRVSDAGGLAQRGVQGRIGDGLREFVDAGGGAEWRAARGDRDVERAGRERRADHGGVFRDVARIGACGTAEMMAVRVWAAGLDRCS